MELATGLNSARPETTTSSIIRHTPSQSYRPDPIRETIPSKVDKTRIEETMPSKVDETNTEERYATVQKSMSPYDQASAYVKDYESWRTGSSGRYLRRLEDFEKPFSIKMSSKDWYRLSSDVNWEASNEAYPRLSYNASTSALIIQYMPTPLHESISSCLDKQFVLSQANLPRDVARGLRAKFDQDYRGFGGRWEGSKKRPDLGFEQINAKGISELKWVLEVGFAEPYQKLTDDAQLWLEGYPEVSMVVLVNIVETPTYRCPISPDVNPEELGIPSHENNVLKEDVIIEGDLGPATYQELRWVQQISEIWMEIWVRDANGNAIRRDNPMDLLTNAQFQIPLQEFLILPPGSEETITVELEDYRGLLKSDIRTLAVNRCQSAIYDYKKRMGDDDGDYRP